MNTNKLRKIPKISSTFCVYFWHHPATRAWGWVTPCCVSESLGENLNETTFLKAWDTPSKFENFYKRFFIKINRFILILSQFLTFYSLKFINVE